MLDFVPFGSPRREMAHLDLKAGCFSQAGQGKLPKTISAPITTTAIAGDQQFFGFGKVFLSNYVPPIHDTLRGKLSRVVISADVNKGRIIVENIYAAWCHLAQLLIDKIVVKHFACILLFPVLFPPVLEITNVFLFPTSNRNNR